MFKETPKRADDQKDKLEDKEQEVKRPKIGRGDPEAWRKKKAEDPSIVGAESFSALRSALEKLGVIRSGEKEYLAMGMWDAVEVIRQKINELPQEIHEDDPILLGITRALGLRESVRRLLNQEIKERIKSGGGDGRIL